MTPNPSHAKRYLSGMDWLVHGFDYLAKRATGLGNVSQIVWQLAAPLDQASFSDAMCRFAASFPVFLGRAARAWNLAPYWKTRTVRRVPRVATFSLSAAQCDDPNALIAQFAQSAHARPADANETPYLHFTHFETALGCFLVMTFDHRLFDARGAEMFMAEFQRFWEQGTLPEVRFSAPSQLHHWADKFRSGRVVNRRFLRLAEPGTIRILPADAKRTGNGFRFRVRFFDSVHTRELIDQAYRRAGYLMLMPFLLAVGCWAFHPVFQRRGQGTGDYVMPVSVDLRQAPSTTQDAFFNHLSFLMFQLAQRENLSIDQAIEDIKAQFYEQVQSGFARHLSHVSHLMRIAPLPVLSRLMRVYLRGQLASFCFSHVDTTELDTTRILDGTVLRRFHLPRLPLPPGLGLFFHQALDQMSVCLSWVDGMLDDREIAEGFDRLESVLGPASQW